MAVKKKVKMLKNTAQVKFNAPVKRGMKMSMRGTPLTAERKEKFLELFKEGHSVQACARALKLTRTCLYKHRLKDAQFAAAWEDAEKIGTMHLEDELYSVALDRTDRGFIPANIFMLKARKPEVYRDGPSTVVNNNVAFVGEIASAMQRSILDGG